jgi:preprotein translocase subunit SecG
MKNSIKRFLFKISAGHAIVKKPLSLLIFLWLVALLVMGLINRLSNTESMEEGVVYEENSQSRDLNKK